VLDHPHFVATTCCRLLSVSNILFIYLFIFGGGYLQVTVLLVCVFFYPIVIMLQNGVGIKLPCAVFVLVPHVFVGSLITVLMYRNMSFVLRLARIEIAKHVLTRGTTLTDALSKTTWQISVGQGEKIARKILNHPCTDRILAICIVVWIIECAAFPFLAPQNQQWALGRSDECIMITSGFIAPLYFIWTLLMLCLIRGFTSVNRFRVAWKIKVQATAALAILIFSFLLFIVFRVGGGEYWISTLGLHLFWLAQVAQYDMLINQNGLVQR